MNILPPRNRIKKIWPKGIQSWGIRNYNNYAPDSDWKHYTIPIGKYFTGNFNYITFSNDADAGQATDVYFRNIKIYSGDTKTTYYIANYHEETVYSNGTESNTNYYYANGERLAKKVNNNGNLNKYYIHGDHLGSTDVITNEAGD